MQEAEKVELEINSTATTCITGDLNAALALALRLADDSKCDTPYIELSPMLGWDVDEDGDPTGEPSDTVQMYKIVVSTHKHAELRA